MTPSRSAVVVNVTRVAVRVPLPEIVMVWVTPCSGSAPNGVDVSTGVASTAGVGGGVGAAAATAPIMPATDAATDSHIPTL
ncbi:hypothetical protein B0E53_01714 [Micromonospora sp. MH33]|nr:hypothetical protein B0E53_01714 [Micromonospora sp. MH33]